MIQRADRPDKQGDSLGKTIARFQKNIDRKFFFVFSKNFL